MVMTWFLLISSLAVCTSASKLQAVTSARTHTHALTQNVTAFMQQMAVKHGQNQTSEGDGLVIAGKEPYQCNQAKDCAKSVTYTSENKEDGCLKCGEVVEGGQCLHIGPMVECPTQLSAVPGIDDEPVEWYVADDYESGTWPNRGTSGTPLTGVKIHGTVQKTTSQGNGASAAITTLKGDRHTRLNLGTGRSLQDRNYAMCVLSRYAGPHHGRILNGGGNWLFGHWAGRAGVAHLNGWLSGHHNRVNPKTNWMHMCCSDNTCKLNGGTFNGHVRPPHHGSLGIHAGGCCTGEVSDWEFSELIIWNKKLSPDQLNKADQYLKNVLEGGPRR